MKLYLKKQNTIRLIRTPTGSVSQRFVPRGSSSSGFELLVGAAAPEGSIVEWVFLAIGVLLMAPAAALPFILSAQERAGAQ